jgi:Fic family protein
MVLLIAGLDQFKGEWNAGRRPAKDRLAALQRAATIKAVACSARIDGGRLRDQDVALLLEKPLMASLRSHDEQLAAGHLSALEAMQTPAPDQPDYAHMTEAGVKRLHHDLLFYAGGDASHRGNYKILPNHLEAFDRDGNSLGVIVETASPFETPERMIELLARTERALADGAIHPLLVIAIFVVVFLEIHPFEDGNGPMSRLLTGHLLRRAGYDYLPYYALDKVVEDRMDDYYLALRRTQITLRGQTADWQPWILFFLRALQEQKNRLRAAIGRETAQFGDQFGDLPYLSLQILETARRQGRVTVASAAKSAGASRNTVKDHMRTLQLTNRLTRHGAGRGTWYTLVG